MKRFAFLLAIVAAIALYGQDTTKKAAPKAGTAKSGAKKVAAEPEPKRDPGTYAVLTTGMGKIVAKFYEKEAPKTVANFIGLAEGTKEWTDPRTGKKAKAKLYDGTVFHRTIPGFMIQGGDPMGTGSGEIGYIFDNESSPGLDYSRAGRLAMANRGPNTNGSQFFITDVPVGLPAAGYTIFGQVVEGMDVVSKIATQPCTRGTPCTSAGNNDKPVKPVKLISVKILRVKG